jgi:hypothetical protein
VSSRERKFKRLLQNEERTRAMAKSTTVVHLHCPPQPQLKQCVRNPPQIYEFHLNKQLHPTPTSEAEETKRIPLSLTSGIYLSYTQATIRLNLAIKCSVHFFSPLIFFVTFDRSSYSKKFKNYYIFCYDLFCYYIKFKHNL